MTAAYPGLRAPPLAPDLLSGRSVLVTGGSMGIGLACARQALACGGSVTIAARGRDELERARAGLAAEFGADRVLAVPADVSAAADVAALVTAATERFDAPHALIHCAAVLGPIGPTLDVEPAAWLEAVRVNLHGSLLVAQAVGRAMREAGRGRMVLLSGGGATSPFPNYTAYAAGKVAVVRLAETLAQELEPYGIAVNALAPGFVATRIHESTLAAGDRAGEAYLRSTREQLEEGGVPPELSAAAGVFLASDAAAGINARLVSAPWDEWWTWPERTDALTRSDLFTLRRIVPRDRGMDWQ